MEQPINTPTPAPSTPHVSFIAYPIGAWLIALIGAGIFTLISTDSERMSIMQILIASGLAVATVAGTLYVLSLLALKRYPKFLSSFILGFLNALLCVAVALIVHAVQFSFIMGGVFLVISALLPFFMKKRVVA